MALGRARFGATTSGVVFTLSIALAAPRAQAQQQVGGFAVERFYPSAPGAGWLVMDALDMHGRIGGVIALSVGYTHKALRVATSDGSQRLPVVSHQAFADVGLALTYDRYRLYLNFVNPIAKSGESGTVGAYQFTAPSVDVAQNPDLISDVRIGFDVRLLGDATSSFRLGAGAQLLTPNGNRADYDTDGTFRAMIRALFAGDAGLFTYAGQVGVHIRPLDDSPAPGSPRGSELLFGIGAGRKLPIGRSGNAALVVGPEIFGETALRSFFGATTTGVEGLLTGRLEQTGDDGPQLRFKMGTGGGIHAHFGAPEWRIAFGIEMSGHHR